MNLIRQTLLIAVLCAVPIVTSGASTPGSGEAWLSRGPLFEVEAEHTLTLEDRERLNALGCVIVREIGGKRYLARVSPATATAVRTDDSIASLSPLRPGRKVLGKRSGALTLEGITAANLFFADDVSFDQALRIVTRSGGVLENPMVTEFGPSRRLRVLASPDALDELAASDSVWSISRTRRKIIPLNQGAAILSSVTPLHTAPYDLSGDGVTVSLWDIGSAFAGHQEFGGRLTAHDAGKADAPLALHPTHTSGTVGAAGNNPPARGMAPRVRIHQYNVGQQWDSDKQTQFAASLGIAADNNSWGYAHGWHQDTKRSPSWVWYGNDLYGSYEFETDALDEMIIDQNVLVVFSSGNDGTDTGPAGSPFSHFHDFGTTPEDKTVYCFSPSGSGTDCPTPQCGSCEAERHVPNGPFFTAGPMGSGKNVITVGAVDTAEFNAEFSSRGPTLDGRVKPDLVAKGLAVFSTSQTGSYTFQQGTSMSTPVVTGISALLIEQWKRTFATSPQPDELRAVLLHGAKDLGNAGPDYTYGYGLANAQNSVDTILADQGTGLRIRRGSLSQGQAMEFGLKVSGGSPRVTLAWADPAAGPATLERTALVNDLDLVVIDPSGAEIHPWVLDPAAPSAPATRGRNFRDNLEQIDLMNAVPGMYRIRILGGGVSTAGPQSFVIVAGADIGNFTPACYDIYEPNDDEGAAFGRLSPSGSISPRICAAADLDFFRFTVDRSGPVVVTVTTRETPLRVTLSANGMSPVTATIPADTTDAIRVQAGTGSNQTIAPISYILRIEAAGEVPAAGSAYTVATSFNTSVVPRRRAASRR